MRHFMTGCSQLQTNLNAYFGHWGNVMLLTHTVCETVATKNARSIDNCDENAKVFARPFKLSVPEHHSGVNRTKVVPTSNINKRKSAV